MSEMTGEVLHGTPAAEPERRAPAWRWIVQGARSAVFLRPDWTGLRGTPWLLASACIANIALAIGFNRLYIPGPATFRWFVLAYGWFQLTIVVWGCWIALRGRLRSDASPGVVDVPALLMMLWTQGFVLSAIWCLAYLPLFKGMGGLHWPTGAWIYAPVILQVGWCVAAQIGVALAGTRSAGRWPRAALVATLLLAMAVQLAMPLSYWLPDSKGSATTRAAPPPQAASAASNATDGDDGADDEAEAGPEVPMLKLSQETFEHQQRLLATQLEAIAPQRPGVVDMYAITFAPYADVDVFMRESEVVAGVMAQRFDAHGRTLQLVSNVATTERLPWATPLNLERSIAHMAQRMDRDNDILFIHLTSHGGADGHLAAEFFPLTVDEVTPQALRRWLDDAHIRNRVISISACFSGSWIAPLASDDTLVMTAADADHTSYGCGSKSTLTFFGQAMYDEQLRHTWSFEQAHAASRKLIEQREKAAGKEDGYSNPQISVGPRIRERLKALEARLAASAAAGR